MSNRRDTADVLAELTDAGAAVHPAVASVAAMVSTAMQGAEPDYDPAHDDAHRVERARERGEWPPDQVSGTPVPRSVVKLKQAENRIRDLIAERDAAREEAKNLLEDLERATGRQRLDHLPVSTGPTTNYLVQDLAAQEIERAQLRPASGQGERLEVFQDHTGRWHWQLLNVRRVYGSVSYETEDLARVAAAQAQEDAYPDAVITSQVVRPADLAGLGDLPTAQGEYTAVQAAAARIVAECHRGMRKFAPMNSEHEGYAVILEELDEAWQEIKHGTPERAHEEMVQVGAMALRFLVDLGGGQR